MEPKSAQRSGLEELAARDYGANAKDDSATGDQKDPQLFRAGAQGAGTLRRSRHPVFGIEPRTTLHRAAQQEIKGQLINLRFYTECMTKTLNNIIEWFDTLEKYDDEHESEETGDRAKG